MPIDLSAYDIEIGDFVAMVVKLNAMKQAIQDGVNSNEVSVDGRLDDQDAIVAALSGAITSGVTFKGTHSAAGGVYPTSPAPANGDYWIISAAGTVSNIYYNVGDAIIYYSSAWIRIPANPDMSRINPLTKAVRINMQESMASTYQGIYAPIASTNTVTTGDFSMAWEGALTTTVSTNAQRIIGRYQDLDNRIQFTYTPSTKSFSLLVKKAGITLIDASYVYSAGLTLGVVYKLKVTILRETASSAGAVIFYVDGISVGSAAITAAATVDISNTGNWRISGTSVAAPYMIACEFRGAAIYNMVQSAVGVLAESKNGPDYADTGANQTALTSGTLTIGKRYRIGTFVSGDSFTNVGAGSNATGVEFIATGTTPTTWTNSSSLLRIGIMGEWNAEDSQGNTNQIFDRSGNKKHAKLPVFGATRFPIKRDFEIRWTNTWAGTHEAQYIGGVNEAILNANAYITSIVGKVAGASGQTIIVGDGSATSKFVASVAIVNSVQVFTVASATNDGTNLKMVADPNSNFTGSIAWTIRGYILEV